MVNAEQLKKLHIGAEWVDALNETFGRFNISTKRQQAAFIADVWRIMDQAGNLLVRKHHDYGPKNIAHSPIDPWIDDY